MKKVKVARRFAVINDQIDNGMYWMGMCDNYYAALGKVMTNIYDFKTSYEDEGDEFDFTEPILMEGAGGEFIEVTFKAKTWDKAETERYYILYCDDERRGDEGEEE